MPWTPTTDFEEEVVNLQPDHDFIYGTLSEPQYNYPRPQAHVEYAEKRKIEKKRAEENSTAANKINAKLKAIAQVQHMANTKPLGEQPTLDDWESKDKIEQEIVGMLRYHGLPLSVEQPLNEKVTISTFPVENSIKVVKNGRKKVAYFFDDNVFQLKQRVSDSSSGFESHNANDSLVSDIGDNESLPNTSFNTSTSLSSHSFGTCDNNSGLTDSFTSAVLCSKTPTEQKSLHLNAQRLRQYEKLLEETASLSLSCNNVSNTSSADSFKSTEERHNSWKPLPDDYDVDNILNNPEDWPNLLKSEKDACNSSMYSDSSRSKSLSDSNDIFTTDNNTTSSSSISSNGKTNFLERFISPEYLENAATATNSPATAFIKEQSCKPKTYASITKETKQSNKTASKTSEEMSPLDFIPFYTPRKMYALKRKVK